MHMKMQNLRTRLRGAHTRSLFGFLALALAWLTPVLACGSFQPREAPTAATETLEQPADNIGTQGDLSTNSANDANTGGISESDPLPDAPTSTPEPLPSPTFTATPPPGTELTPGQPARVVAPNGLNMRQSASSSSQLVVQLGTGQRVDVLSGPATADGYTWWQVTDQQGNSGWVAQGDSETVWLSPSIGEPQPVGRAPEVGDRVRVTMESGLQLTLRALPGTDGPLVTRINPGTEFTVINGPQQADGFSWYQLRSDDGSTLGWAADADSQGEDRWLSPIE